MSILNQAIPGNGQPLFPSKVSQDVCQHLPTALPLHGAHSAKSFLQPNDALLIKKTSLTLASIGSDSAAKRETFQNGTLDGSTGDSISNLSHLLGSDMRRDFHNEICQTAVHSAVEFEPLPLSFLRSCSVKPVKEQVANVHLSAAAAATATVVVSSAVKLNGSQIELIARKMKRVTGSNDLRLENTVDASLIAGFIISYDNSAGETQAIDLSVKGQLAALAAEAESSDQRIASFGFSSRIR